MNKQKQLIETAQALVGTPYKYGAIMEEAPQVFDCSGFIKYLFEQIGIELPRSTVLQAADSAAERLDATSELQLGDLLFMRSDRGHYRDDLFDGEKIYIGHVVMYVGDNTVIHAKQSKGGVIAQNLDELTQDPNYHILFVKRYPLS